MTTKFTKSEIFVAYNQLKAIAKRDGDTKKIDRLNKALGILMSNNYYADKEAYSPSIGSCGCKDWEFNYSKKRAYTGPCKHMLAELMIQMILDRREAHNVTAKLVIDAPKFQHKYVMF